MGRERGQALVLLVFGMVAMLAVAGLAVDGGRYYAARRQVQSAADAAALAAARELADLIRACASGSVADDDRVAQALVELARANGVDHFAPDGQVAAWYVDAEENRLGPVGFGQGIPQGATGVEVSLRLTETTTFMKVTGRQVMVSGGEAMAMTGPVRQFSGGGGIIPIGVPLQVVQELDEGETFYMLEDNVHQGGMFCREPDGLCIGDPAAANAHRGWLNLNYIYNPEHRTADDPLNRAFVQEVPDRGCGPYPEKSVDDGLQGWAGDECPYPFPIFAGTPEYLDGDFIHGDPGARQVSLMSIVATYNHQTVYVPVFDHIYLSDYMRENFIAPENPPDGHLIADHWPYASGGDHAFLYHVIGFAAVRIDDPDVQDHVLVGSFQSVAAGASQVEPSAGLGETVGSLCGVPIVYGVTLWR